MQHHVFGRKLNRSSNERKRLFRNLTRSLILNGQITTSKAKAKAIQPLIEKLITRAKENNLTNRRLLLKELADEEVVNKMLSEIGPLFKNRPGGYTRIIKLDNRLGDNTELVSFSFTQIVSKTSKPKKVEKEKKKVAEKNINKEKEINAKDKINKRK